MHESGARVVRCMFMVRTVDQRDTNICASTVLPCNSDTTAEDIVQSAARHVTKMRASLVCPPESIAVTYLRDGRTVTIPRTERLSSVEDLFATGRTPMLYLSAPTADEPLSPPLATSTRTAAVKNESFSAIPRTPQGVFYRDASGKDLRPDGDQRLPSLQLSQRPLSFMPFSTADGDAEMALCREELRSRTREIADVEAQHKLLMERRQQVSRLKSERDALLQQRASARDRWMECATVTRDIERLKEQIEWFSSEVAESKRRETSLALKLQRIEDLTTTASANAELRVLYRR